MKKILLFLSFLFVFSISFGQLQINDAFKVIGQKSVDDKQYYTENNKHVPYDNISEFFFNVPKTRRHIGEIAYVYDSSKTKINVWQFVGGIDSVNFKIISSATKQYVDSLIDKNIVKDITWGVIDSIRNAPSSPVQGDRYLVSTTATGTFTGKQNLIATYDTTLSWQFQSASTGDLLFNSANYNTYKWTGSTWVLRPPLPFDNWWKHSAPGYPSGVYAQNNGGWVFFKSNGDNTIGIGAQVFDGSHRLGIDNIAIGRTSQYHNYGDRNISMGTYSLWYNVVGHDQIAIGYRAAGTGNQIYSIGLGTDVGNRNRTLSISDSTTGMYMKLDTTAAAPTFLIGRNTDNMWKSYRLSNILGTAGAGIFIPLAEKGQPNGVPNLDASGKVPVSQLPALTVNQPSYVQHLSDMLSSGAVVGDIVVVGDSSKSYALMTAPASTFSNWLELQSPIPANTDLLPEGSTNKYYTDIRSRNAISGTGRVTYNNSTGVIGVISPDWNVAGDILNKPTIPAQLIPLVGNNISITGTYPNLQWDVTGIYDKAQTDSITTKLRTEITVAASGSITLNQLDSVHTKINDSLAYYPMRQEMQDSLLAVRASIPAPIDISGKLDKSDSSLYTTVTRLNDTASAIRGSFPAQSWASITGKPTTLSGYGITDGVTIGTDQVITGKKNFSRYTTVGDYARVFNNINSGTGGIGVNLYDDQDSSGYRLVNEGAYAGTGAVLSIIPGSGLQFLTAKGTTKNVTPTIKFSVDTFGLATMSNLKLTGIQTGTLGNNFVKYESDGILRTRTQNEVIADLGISAKMNYTDTSAMLSPLWNKINSQTTDTVTANTPLHIVLNQSTNKQTLYVDTASATKDGALLKEDWSTFNGKQNQILLTTNGTSGAATLTGSTLNIPQYPGGASWGSISGTLSSQNDLQNALNGKQDKLISISNQSNNYTLALTDANGMLREGSSAATTVTVPTNATVAFPIGTQINIMQASTAQVTIAGASGVTINSADAKTKTRVQFSTVTLLKTATDTWLLFGDISN